jgi:hypothetical protein
MEITFYFKPTPKGFRAKSNLIEASIYKGMSGWGRTKDNAVFNLTKRWNAQVEKDRPAAEEKYGKENVKQTVLTYKKAI